MERQRAKVAAYSIVGAVGLMSCSYEGDCNVQLRTLSEWRMKFAEQGHDVAVLDRSKNEATVRFRTEQGNVRTVRLIRDSSKEPWLNSARACQ